MGKMKVTVKRPGLFWNVYLKIHAKVCGVKYIEGFTTYWNTIIIRDDKMTDLELLAHELTHIKQIKNHGICKFTYLYLKEFFKYGYHDNKFEIEARNTKTYPLRVINQFEIKYK